MVWKKTSYLKKPYLKKSSNDPLKNLPPKLQNCIKNNLKRLQKSSKNHPQNPPKIPKNSIEKNTGSQKSGPKSGIVFPHNTVRNLEAHGGGFKKLNFFSSIYKTMFAYKI